MFVMVVGSGRLASGLARVLSSRGNDVVVVAESVDSRWLGSDFDGVVVEGNPIDEEVLESAGIRKAEIFVAAAPDDVVNAMAAQVAKAVFGVKLALARLTDPARERFYRSIGVDTVCPTSTGINQVLDMIQRASFSSLRGYVDPGIVGIVPPPEWIGQRLSDLPLPQDRRVLGLERKGRLLQAEAGIILGEGDRLLLERSGGPKRGGL
jgi:trk system potassium uptake protein TrkA